jgi:lysophospholipase L1-like esterase
LTFARLRVIQIPMQTITKPKALFTPTPPRKLMIVSIAETLLVLLIVVLSLESILHLAGLGEQELLRLDPVYGAVPMPHKDYTQRVEGYARIHLNRLGMNDIDRPLNKPPGTTRIAVLGDSMVESLQVPREKNFLSILERGLNTTSHPVEVLNYGASGYNMGQMYLRLRDMVMQSHPDIALLCVRKDAALVLVPNPDGKILLFARPTFYLDKDNRLCLDYSVQNKWMQGPEAVRMRTTAWLREHSRIWGLVGRTMGSLITLYQTDLKWLHDVFEKPVANKPTVTGGPPGYDWVGCSREECDRNVWPVMDVLIDLMDQTCRKNNCRLVILRLPPYDDQDAELESTMLAASAAKRQIPFLSMVAPFHEALKSGQKGFYTVHFNPTGHQLLANGLIDFFENCGLMACPQSRSRLRSDR